MRHKISSFLKSPIKLIIFGLVGFLILYHMSKLVSLYFGAQDLSVLTHGQSLLRLAIVAGLFALIKGVPHAIWAMWVSIVGLVVLQYVGSTELVPTSGFDPSLLRGFIIPTVISVLLWVRRNRQS